MLQPRGLSALPELHVSFCAAAPSPPWVERIPQPDAVAGSRSKIEAGDAVPPDTPGLGIAWRWDELRRRADFSHTIT